MKEGPVVRVREVHLVDQDGDESRQTGRRSPSPPPLKRALCQSQEAGLGMIRNRPLSYFSIFYMTWGLKVISESGQQDRIMEFERLRTVRLSAVEKYIELQADRKNTIYI